MSASDGRMRQVLIVIALGLLTVLFFTTCERKTRELAVGFQGEARRNPYLAAQRMLERMDVPVRAIESIDELDTLPETDGTLILPTPRRTVSTQRNRQLREWLDSGGHLVVLAWTDWESDAERDPLLDAFDVRQFVWKGDEEEVDPDAPEPQTADPAEAMAEEDEALDLTATATVEIPGRDTPLRVAFDPLYRLERPSGEVRFQIADTNGVHLMHFPVGQGLLTVLTDDYLMRNDTIDDEDHAELFWRLVHGFGAAHERRRPVWIVFDEDYPGLLALTWKHAWTIVISLAALLLGWLGYASRRYGPLVPDASLERRRLMEHVEAAGRFQWRRGQRLELLEGVRGALMDRVRERHPGWTRLDPAELARRLADLSDLPRENVARALGFRRDADRDTFSRDIATLERIRGAL